MIRLGIFVCLLGVVCCFISSAEALDAEGIRGGDYAEMIQFKYQVSIQINGGHFCGGAILSDYHIATAAHCVIGDNNEFNNYKYRVIAGIVNLNTMEGYDVQSDVEKIFVPSDYAPFIYTGDIAVIKVKDSLRLPIHQHLKSVKLPSPTETFAGKKAVVTGYGWNYVNVVKDPHTGHLKEEGGLSDNILRFARVNVLSNDDCRITNYPQLIYDKHICGKMVQRKRRGESEGVCAGDSGSPLVFNNTLIGIVSSSPTGCDETRQAAVYTRVSEYLDFIHNAMNNTETNTMRCKVYIPPSNYQYQGSRGFPESVNTRPLTYPQNLVPTVIGNKIHMPQPR